MTFFENTQLNLSATSRNYRGHLRNLFLMSISDIIPSFLLFSRHTYDDDSSGHWQAASFFYSWGEREDGRKEDKRTTSFKFFKAN